MVGEKWKLVFRRQCTRVLGTRGVSASMHSARRHVLSCSPVSAQSINVLRLSILFPLVLFCTQYTTCHCHHTISTFGSPALVAIAHSRSRARARAHDSHKPTLCFDHVTPPGRTDCRLPWGYTAQLLIALPISARARSRSTSPAAGLQRNTCPIINSHDPPITEDSL